MNDLIIIKQLPVIEEKLKVLSAEIQTKIDNALALECTEESKTKVKKIRAELNGTKKEYEDRRIEAKNSIMKPYNDFEALYKEYISDKLKAADRDLKAKIDAIENEQKAKAETEVKEYFNEYRQSKNIDFITYENANINVTLSASMKSLKEQAEAFIDRVSDDLALIDTQEFKAEIMVEYKKFLNASAAITAVMNRHKEIEQEQAKAVEVEAVKVVEEKTIEKVESVSAPVVEEQEYTLKFSVTATRDKLKALKQFLNEGGYDYE
jgi:hypothetical protein